MNLLINFIAGTLVLTTAVAASVPASSRHPGKPAAATKHNAKLTGYEVTPEGAWCWFADPRAIHFKSKDGKTDRTFIGYIDVHGNIKAMQVDNCKGTKEEVLIRSWFQPDDHNNPTFLVLPDERIMVFYSRHTDEPCFNYRVSREPGDITTLGEEKIIKTLNNTTYPSPFILSDDPSHIYLCWRGIKWHPTIGRLLIPDKNGDTSFDWGPYQMVQSTGARPYAKYTSNGKDKIYFTYTTGHPDNEQPNYVYLNYVDINSKKLKDIRGKVLSAVQEGPHQVNKTADYVHANPDAVVADTPYRNWVWEVAVDSVERPVIAMTRISPDKKSHAYYHAKWNSKGWDSVFLSNGGGHFHQSPDIEHCYSGGMAIDDKDHNRIVCSVPVNGVYELVAYTIDENGSVTTDTITNKSKKNNIRPYFIKNTNNDQLLWMNGDYYDWIVSSRRPDGYCTGIRSSEPLPDSTPGAPAGKAVTPSKVKVGDSKPFSITFDLKMNPSEVKDYVLRLGNITYSVNPDNLKPTLQIGSRHYGSTNVLGTSDCWRKEQRSTGGQWPAPESYPSVSITLTFDGARLKTYINGLLDQNIPLNSFDGGILKIGDFNGSLDITNFSTES